MVDARALVSQRYINNGAKSEDKSVKKYERTWKDKHGRKHDSNNGAYEALVPKNEDDVSE